MNVLISYFGKADLAEISGKINADEEQELMYWCRRFDCTEKQIWAAMSVVGPMSLKVENFLRLTHQIE